MVAGVAHSSCYQFTVSSWMDCDLGDHGMEAVEGDSGSRGGKMDRWVIDRI